MWDLIIIPPYKAITSNQKWNHPIKRNAFCLQFMLQAIYFNKWIWDGEWKKLLGIFYIQRKFPVCTYFTILFVFSSLSQPTMQPTPIQPANQLAIQLAIQPTNQHPNIYFNRYFCCACLVRLPSTIRRYF